MKYHCLMFTFPSGIGQINLSWHLFSWMPFLSQTLTSFQAKCYFTIAWYVSYGRLQTNKTNNTSNTRVCAHTYMTKFYWTYLQGFSWPETIAEGMYPCCHTVRFGLKTTWLRRKLLKCCFSYQYQNKICYTHFSSFMTWKHIAYHCSMVTKTVLKSQNKWRMNIIDFDS